ncbi:MAG: SpoIIE family protein phosphatase [Pyrinomonadaceae bacterium]|nr:SpoIIE family protein phosphatase [Pyrinomonadaceae bacterium]
MDKEQIIEETHSSSSPDERLSLVDKLRMLLDITKTISQTMDTQEVLTFLMDTLGSLIPYDAAGIYLIEMNDDKKNPYIFKSKVIRGYRLSFEQIEPSLRLGEGFIGHVALTGRSIISPDVSEDDRYFPARKRTRSEIVVPIISNDKVIGVFDLESDRLNAYSEDDLSMLQLLASQVAIIIEKSRLYEELVEKKRLQTQLEIAREVQLELLPDGDPQMDGFDICAYIFPTEEVSGDYYDWVKIYDDQLAIIVADAVGKGIPAALLMAFLRASLRAGVQIGYAPQVAFSKVGDLLWDSVESHQFITAVYGMLDTTNRTFVYSNAGHNPPLLVKPNGEFRYVEYGDLPLGMFRDKHYHQHFIRLEEQQILILYTDGIIEAANDTGEEYGLERFAHRVIEGFDLTAKEMIEFIREDLVNFTESEFLSDDGTLFIVKPL